MESTETHEPGERDPSRDTPRPESSDPSAEKPKASASIFPTQSPLDGSALSEVTATDVEALRSMVEKAREAQRKWSDRPVR